MEAHEYYKKETGKLYYKEAALELELTDDYINWLEQNVVKLFAIPAVVGQEVKKLNIPAVIKSVCDECTAYPFDERGKTALCKTCKDNPSQAEKELSISDAIKSFLKI